MVAAAEMTFHAKCAILGLSRAIDRLDARMPKKFFQRPSCTEAGYLFGAPMMRPVRLAIGLATLVELLERRGQSTSALLEKAQIPSFALEEPRYKISIEQELAFTGLALKALPPVESGLNVGRRSNITLMGVVGLAAATSPSVLEALKVILSYPALVWSVFNVAVWRNDRSVFVSFSDPGSLGVTEPFFAMRDIACGVTLLRDAVEKPIAPEVVRLSQSRPACFRACEDFFRCSVLFDQPVDEITFRSRDMDQDLPKQNKVLNVFLHSQCRELSKNLSEPLNYSEIVRGRLEVANTIPSLKKLTRDLNIADRTLQRHLSNEGTSFSEILRSVREHRAVELLTTSPMLVDQIAYRLGYLDYTVFSRAFKKWTGCGPKEFRELHRTAASAAPTGRAA